MSEIFDDERLAIAYERALELEKDNQFEAAAQLYQTCLNIDPADHCGASVRLASMGSTPPPKKAPDAYVTTLFDQHAEYFDKILKTDLGYRVPEQIAETLSAAQCQFEYMLDLGCGTGYAAEAMNTLCTHMTGVDISENMIKIADKNELYDTLYINEALYFLEEWEKESNKENASNQDFSPFDIIIAADMLPYIGELDYLFDLVKKNLRPGGCFTFSCETLDSQDFAGKPWTVTPNHRFAHDKDYLNTMLKAYNFTNISSFDAITVRMEQGAPIPGWLVIAWQEEKS